MSLFRPIFTHALSLRSLHNDYPPCIFDANKLYVLETCQKVLLKSQDDDGDGDGNASAAAQGEGAGATEEDPVTQLVVSKFGPPSGSALQDLWQRNIGFDEIHEDIDSERMVANDPDHATKSSAGGDDYGVHASATRFEYDTPSVLSDGDGIATRHWFVNFADPSLFVAYGGGLFAQDEIQVAEHPDLGCVREALKHLSSIDSKFAPRTVSGGPTPIAVENARRACSFDTSVIYGNAFQRANRSTIDRAMTVLESPTNTSFICMAAVRPRIGAYTTEDVETLTLTAVTAFAGVRARSDEGCRSIVHTGNWGCGAFGGNKRLVAAIQVAAARIAGVELYYHCFNEPSLFDFRQGLLLLDEWRRRVPWKEQSLQSLVDFLVAKRIQWGVSDGN